MKVNGVLSHYLMKLFQLQRLYSYDCVDSNLIIIAAKHMRLQETNTKQMRYANIQRLRWETEETPGCVTYWHDPRIIWIPVIVERVILMNKQQVLI